MYVDPRQHTNVDYYIAADFHQPTSKITTIGVENCRLPSQVLECASWWSTASVAVSS
jgi:hypothetical protein